MDDKNTPKISVIVPVYKVEQYLSKCIDSILAQTFSDFELLLINDGSPDRSGRICDEYSALDNRIRVFHKENGGVSSARNIGLDKAKGEWFVFFDSDDYMYPECLSTFSSLINRNLNYHVYAGNFVMQMGKESYNRHITGYTNYTGEIINPIHEIINARLYLRPGSFITNKKQYFSTDISIFEDTAYVFDLLNGTDIFYSDFITMSYLNNQDGASRKFHNYKKEWIYNVPSRYVRKFFFFFFRHLLQRVSVHLRHKDYKGSIILSLRYFAIIVKK